MITPQMKEYVDKARQSGSSDDAIRSELVKAGWLSEDVTLAMAKPIEAPKPEPTPAPLPPPAKIELVSVKPSIPLDWKKAAEPVVETVEPGKSRKWLMVAVAIVVLLAVGGTAYAFKFDFGFLKFGFGSKAPYSEADLVSGLLAKSSSVETSTYRLGGSLNVVPREKDAATFTVQVSNEGKLREQYQNDSTRIRDIQMLLMTLQSYQIADYKTKAVKKFPADLKQVMADNSSIYVGSTKTDFTDPVSGEQYEYTVVDGGNDFNLKVTFETPGAISALKKSYKFVATSTPVSGNTVTFTKKSPTYFYMSSEPPKPFMAQLGEMARMMPEDMKVSLSSGASTDWKNVDADWSWDFDGNADFGDMTYAINFEALRKEGQYYFRLNKIPGLFAAYLGTLKKGQWIKIDPTSTSTKSGSMLFGMNDISKYEKSYKESREQASAFVKKVAAFADEEKLLEFKGSPQKKEQDGTTLYQYDFKIRKDALLPFYKKLQAEARANEKLGLKTLADDQGLIEYLQSPEFDQVFDYYDKNTSMSLLADEGGYLRGFTYKMRIVPPDTAVNLKDKQADLVLNLEVSDINKGIKIEAPAEWKSLDDVIEEMQTNMNRYAPGSAEAVRSELDRLRYSTYSTTEKSGKSFSLGKCTKATGTIFGDAEVFKAIEAATANNPSSATCASIANGIKTSAYAISVPIPKLPGYSWCVDSTGVSKQINGSLKGTACK